MRILTMTAPAALAVGAAAEAETVNADFLAALPLPAGAVLFAGAFALYLALIRGRS
jgi:hypothetical protein